jgi:hypothetical protein
MVVAVAVCIVVRFKHHLLCLAVLVVAVLVIILVEDQADLL